MIRWWGKGLPIQRSSPEAGHDLGSEVDNPDLGLVLGGEAHIAEAGHSPETEEDRSSGPEGDRNPHNSYSQRLQVSEKRLKDL